MNGTKTFVHAHRLTLAPACRRCSCHATSHQANAGATERFIESRCNIVKGMTEARDTKALSDVSDVTYMQREKVTKCFSPCMSDTSVRFFCLQWILFQGIAITLNAAKNYYMIVSLTTFFLKKIILIIPDLKDSPTAPLFTVIATPCPKIIISEYLKYRQAW